ncbi:MAG TPA: hypothetical protein VHM90_17160 [Phycisphaerae bacterium]|nr:hypothetical protein [Phycisphaerae bacterium]
MLGPALAFGLLGAYAEEKPASAVNPASDAAQTPARPTPANPNAPPPSPDEGRQPFLLPPPVSATDSSVPRAAAGSSSAADKANTVSANPEFFSVIKRAFPYVPPPQTEEATVDAGTSPAVEMKPFHVATSRITERVTKAFEERRQKQLEEAFNVKDGGRIGKIGPAAVGLKYNPQHKGWDILSIPW